MGDDFNEYEEDDHNYHDDHVDEDGDNEFVGKAGKLLI